MTSPAVSGMKEENEMKTNLILDADSYKSSHAWGYPPGTTGLFQYLESRGGKYGQTVFFGLQPILKRLEQGFTEADVTEAAELITMHGLPFPKDGFTRVIKDLKGKIPLRIRAVPEGTVVPTYNVLMTVESTDPQTFWLATYFETMLMRVWYPITVATQSWHIR